MGEFVVVDRGDAEDLIAKFANAGIAHGKLEIDLQLEAAESFDETVKPGNPASGVLARRLSVVNSVMSSSEELPHVRSLSSARSVSK